MFYTLPSFSFFLSCALSLKSFHGELSESQICRWYRWGNRQIAEVLVEEVTLVNHLSVSSLTDFQSAFRRGDNRRNMLGAQCWLSLTSLVYQ